MNILFNKTISGLEMNILFNKTISESKNMEDYISPIPLGKKWG